MANVYGSAVPTNTTGSDPGPQGLLSEFSVSGSGTITGIRWYSMAGMSSSDFQVILYAGPGNQTQLANKIFTPNTALGWHTYTFNTPISLVAGQHYVLNVGMETGTQTYSYGSGELPKTANGITMHNSAFRNGGGDVWAENNTVALTGINDYFIDVEVSVTTALDVNAGVDQNIFTTQVASLTAVATGGSGTKAYTWTKVSGPAGTFSAPSSATTSFTPTGGAGTYVLRALVTDSSGTDQDDVTITVTAAPTLVSYDSIASSTGWTPTGGTVLAVISDSSDSTLITSSDNPVNVLLDGYLPAMAAPGSGQNFITRVRCDRPGSSSGTITGRLYEGATLRSTVVASVPASLGDVDISFPAVDLAAISPTAWTAIVTGTRTAMRVTISATAAV